ncbi:MAG: hypothetical protein RIR11_650, partial [Bacteroidota bacterium]
PYEAGTTKASHQSHIVFYLWPPELYGPKNSNNKWETREEFTGVQGRWHKSLKIEPQAKKVGRDIVPEEDCRSTYLMTGSVV